MKHAHAAPRAGLTRHPGRWPVATAILLAVALCQPGAARAAMYKWVDDKGVVHYSDKVPPDAVNKANVQLSPQGVPLRKVDPAVSPEQRKARETDQERLQEAAKQQQETARRDRALLDSYTDEKDIDLAKSRAVRTVQAALESAQSYSAQLTKRRAALTERKAAVPAGKPVPVDLERELAAVDAELARQRDVVAQKNRQLVEVNAKYDGDKERWQALKSGTAVAKPASPPGVAAAASPAPAPSSAPAPAPAPAPRK